MLLYEDKRNLKKKRKENHAREREKEIRLCLVGEGGGKMVTGWGGVRWGGIYAGICCCQPVMMKRLNPNNLTFQEVY